MVTPSKRNAALALVCGALILSLAMGIRQTFGLFLTPMSLDLGLGREAFALALAVQNLLWGVLQPISGIAADKYGAVRVLWFGTVAYAIGLLIMSGTTGAAGLHLGAGVLIGLAMSCTSFAVVLGAIGRSVPAEKRSMALGVASAGGSFGQFVMAPVGQSLISSQGWAGALVTMAVLSLAMAPLAMVFATRRSGPQSSPGAPDAFKQSLGEAMGEAGRHGGYWLLTIAFFVCGFQVVFIAVHLPAYLNDLGLAPSLGATALALIGFFNIIGTWMCGALGGRYSKKYLLSTLYILRALVIAVFLMAPKTEAAVLVFASAMGLLWLGTVPLTSGLVAQIFGVRYMSTLFGIVFFGHQVGSFLGVWAGGAVFDATGSYDAIWIASIALGVIAAILHLPIAERPLRPAEA
ncbi:MAG: MFS transporter [Rhodospirillales bacterium]|nr:MFS transporter [Rhodospirillales bacterium]